MSIGRSRAFSCGGSSIAESVPGPRSTAPHGNQLAPFVSTEVPRVREHDVSASKPDSQSDGGPN